MPSPAVELRQAVIVIDFYLKQQYWVWGAQALRGNTVSTRTMKA
jgi:hypothetical protein